MGYIGPNGELHIPEDVREAVGLKPGDPISFIADPAGHALTVLPGSPEGLPPDPLQLRRIVVGGRPLALRLEATLWDALEDIGRREGLSVDEICRLARTGFVRQAQDRGEPAMWVEASLCSALRVFIVDYYRRCAEGLRPAGDGTGHAASAGHAGRRADPAPLHGKPVEERYAIDGIIGIAGRAAPLPSPEDIDRIIRGRAAERALRQ